MRLGGLLRYRYLLLGVSTLGGGGWLIWDLRNVTQIDYLVSLFGGWAMFGWLAPYHHSGLHIYSTNPEIQIGPLALGFVGLLAKIPGDTGRLVVAGVILGCGLLTVWAVERTAINLGVSPRRAQITTLLGGLPVVCAFASVAWFAHVEDAFAITLTALAVAAIAARRPWWLPALALGAALLCKPWAIVALPLLFALDRDRGRAVLGALGVAVVGWAPFVVAAPDTVGALASITNRTMTHSVLSLGFPVGQGAPHGVRSLEMLLGLCMAGFAVSRGRWLAAPLAGFAGRILLEPRWFIYYGASALAAALLWDVTQKRRVPAWTLWTLVAEFGVQKWAPPTVGAVFNLAFAVSIVALLVLAPAVRSVHRDRADDPAAAQRGDGQVVPAGRRVEWATTVEP